MYFNYFFAGNIFLNMFLSSFNFSFRLSSISLRSDCMSFCEVEPSASSDAISSSALSKSQVPIRAFIRRNNAFSLQLSLLRASDAHSVAS